jgi:hypothetical protein
VTRWMGLGVLCLVLAGLGCSEEKDTSRTARVYDQLSARETAYHASVITLPNPDAIRTETANYSSDMHDMLDSMQEACSEMMHGTSTMGGHTMDDMMPIMDRMRSGIDDYTSRMQGMDDMDSMRAACNEHHTAMNEMLQEMDGVLDNSCCGGR